MTDVVFLHGIGTGPQGWSPQVEALSSGGDAVFAPNLTGGFARGWEATIEEVAMLVAGRAPVDLCGISLGALLALRIAADRPSFTRGWLDSYPSGSSIVSSSPAFPSRIARSRPGRSRC